MGARRRSRLATPVRTGAGGQRIRPGRDQPGHMVPPDPDRLGRAAHPDPDQPGREAHPDPDQPDPEAHPDPDRDGRRPDVRRDLGRTAPSGRTNWVTNRHRVVGQDRARGSRSPMAAPNSTTRRQIRRSARRVRARRSWAPAHPSPPAARPTEGAAPWGVGPVAEVRAVPGRRGRWPTGRSRRAVRGNAAVPRIRPPPPVAPKRGAPKPAAPKPAARKRAARKRAARKRAAPKPAAPKRAAPKRAAPKRAAPRRGLRGRAARKPAVAHRVAPDRAGRRRRRTCPGPASAVVARCNGSRRTSGGPPRAGRSAHRRRKVPDARWTGHRGVVRRVGSGGASARSVVARRRPPDPLRMGRAARWPAPGTRSGTGRRAARIHRRWLRSWRANRAGEHRNRGAGPAVGRTGAVGRPRCGPLSARPAGARVAGPARGRSRGRCQSRRRTRRRPPWPSRCAGGSGPAAPPPRPPVQLPRCRPHPGRQPRVALFRPPCAPRSPPLRLPCGVSGDKLQRRANSTARSDAPLVCDSRSMESAS